MACLLTLQCTGHSLEEFEESQAVLKMPTSERYEFLHAQLIKNFHNGVPRVCSTCRWWLNNRSFADGPTWGSCELAGGGDSPDNPESLAWASDEEMYSAELNTRHDFGCNQWSEKE